MPYRFVIADGQVNSGLARLLEDASSLFPALQIEYVRYPNDVDFAHYFRKMVDAFARVRTPYVAVADNDDFLLRAGLEKSMDFLDAHPDYVCCGGGIAGFAVYSRPNDSYGDVRGSLNRFSIRYAPYDRSLDIGSESVVDRLIGGLRNSWSYYAVFRAPALKTIWYEVAEINFSDLQLHEKFCAMRALTLGKAKSDPAAISYLRQYWTTMRSAFSKDWIHHLLRSRFSVDLASLIRRIAEAAATSDGRDKTEIAESLRGNLEGWYGQFLYRNYGFTSRVRRLLRERAPRLLQWLKTRRRFSVARERRALIASLRHNGASRDYVNTFVAELARIEDTIRGAEFGHFLNRHASALDTCSVP